LERELSGRVTQVLEEMRDGKEGAHEELLRLIYEELRRMAGRSMRDQPAGHTLQPTALVNEAYLRLMGGADVAWESRAHFLGTAACAMRSILVDMARARAAQKRGGGDLRLTFKEDLHGRPDAAESVLAIHEALAKLEEVDPRKAEVVQLRFFAGLDVDETARVLDTSKRTVERLWTLARAWLYREIG
jgi:RNA polymerase sigma factor (TIGR02999 family)